LSRLITIAAKKGGGDPDSNFELKYSVNKAKSANMPSDKIENAIKKGTGELQGEKLEEILFETFGPGGSALVITGITDNTNRTSNEIKHLLSKNNSKLATPGSAIWAFGKDEKGKWKPKSTIDISDAEKEKLKQLIEAIEEQEDVQSIFANVTGFMSQDS